jgi:hypothetical protein
MHSLRIYLDTSVFGVIRDVEFAECTRRLFQAIVAGYYVGLNAMEGYTAIEIHSPLEMQYGNEDKDV